LKNLLKPCLQSSGYIHDSSIKPIDLCDINISPLEALQRVNGLRFILNIPLADIRSGMEFAFTVDQDSSYHPFVLTAKWLTKGIDTKPELSPLAKYYEVIQPKKAGDLLRTNIQSKVHNLPVIQSRLPWDNILPGIKAEKELIKMREIEASRLGYNLKNYSYGKFFGPVLYDVIDMEVRRLQIILKSLKKNGYVKNDPVTGFLLVSNNDARILIQGGQHRVACCSVLNINSIPILIKETIIRSQASSWPGVISNWFSIEEALLIFDSVFSGEIPPYVKERWPSVYNEINSKLSIKNTFPT
jgi:hypothetical protein